MFEHIPHAKLIIVVTIVMILLLEYASKRNSNVKSYYITKAPAAPAAPTASTSSTEGFDSSYQSNPNYVYVSPDQWSGRIYGRCNIPVRRQLY